MRLLQVYFLIVGTSLVRASATPALQGINLDQWRLLNATVGGRLHSATPMALPCFSKFKNNTVKVDVQACSEIESNYTSPEFRLQRYSANMNPEYETCMSTHEQCLLDSADPTDPLATSGTSCEQGQISPYYIDVRTASDVQAAYAFSARTKVPLSIKNTGHDYMGRSRQRDSLGLWTHNIDSISYDSNFIPEYCHGSHRAITVGAGVTFEAVYQFADEHDSMFVGGYAQSIGASGGWMMGGGHSVLSPSLGLGVDRILQIKIVTPDGQLRTANACQHPDLFWALRGGGGGTFGVVLESTHLVEKRIPIQTANITFTPSSTNLEEYFEILVNNSVNWGDLGWGGHINHQPPGIIYVNPRISLAEAQLSMRQLSAFAVANNGTAVVETLPSWYAFFQQFILKVEAPVGNLMTLGSRLIPKSNFETDAGRRQLVNLLLTQTAERGLPYIPVGTPISFNSTPGTTSVTPAWRNSLWHLATGATWNYNSTIPEIQAALTSLHNFVQDNFRAVAPDSGSYMNEGDIYETNHEVSYWGPNYDRLLQIKRKYDPLGLLDCWKCVGWKGASEFPCYLPEPSS